MEVPQGPDVFSHLWVDGKSPLDRLDEAEQAGVWATRLEALGEEDANWEKSATNLLQARQGERKDVPGCPSKLACKTLD